MSRPTFLITLCTLLLLYPLVSEAFFFHVAGHHKECSNVESHEDQCAFVMASCKGFSGAYLRLYYCSEMWKPISTMIMISGLLMLFGAVSVVASDFFCPNLQTISTRLQLSESMAGVTVLAFGNGSPDLFSTFSAMDTGAGSMAVGELIGAAFFIVSVVSGCMGIIRPFQSKRITFMRDASFLTGAIIMLTWIVYHRYIRWYHGIALIVYYLTYVFVVVFGAFRSTRETPVQINKAEEVEAQQARDELSEATRLITAEAGVKPPRLVIPIEGFAPETSEVGQHLGHIIRPVSPISSHPSVRSSIYFDALTMPRTTSTNGSISTRLARHAMTPRVGIRTSLFSAIEFQEQITSIQRVSSAQFISNPGSHRRRHASVGQQSWSRSPESFIYPHGQRASAQGDRFLTAGKSSGRATTPDSVGSGPGVIDDYFAYIAANQPSPAAASSTARGHSALAPDSEVTIPEIRLAPPNLEDEYEHPHISRSRSRGSSSMDMAPMILLDAETTPYHHTTTVPHFDHPPQANTHQPHAPESPVTAFEQEGLANANLKPSSTLWFGPLPISVQTYFALEDIWQTLFPTLQEWGHKTVFAKISSLIAVPLVLVFTLTLPVAEGEDVKVDDIAIVNDEIPESDTGYGATAKDFLAVPEAENEGQPELTGVTDEGTTAAEAHPEWSRWLLATQSVCASTFVFGVMAVNGYIAPAYTLIGFGIGCMIAMTVVAGTKVDQPPPWFWMLSFAGFVIALNWIFLLANEMVGLLQALGTIFNISDAIMGLTIFALGNSVGDFVANTAIARMGFPTMAISACYAGPLLNTVLGIGISSTYQVWVTGKPYELEVAPTILVSAAGLITVLLSTLVVVNMNGYFITKELGWWMIIVYTFCCLINILLECHVFSSLF